MIDATGCEMTKDDEYARTPKTFGIREIRLVSCEDPKKDEIEKCYDDLMAFENRHNKP